MSVPAPRPDATDALAELATMVDAAPVMIAAIGPDLRYRMVNAEYERVWGRARDWFIGRAVSDAVPPDIYAIVEPRLRRALAGEDVEFDFPNHRPATDPSRVRHVRARYRPHIADGRQDGIVAVIEDISTSKATEAELAATRDQLRAVVDNVPVFIAYYGADWTFRFANSTYERFYDKPNAWFIGRPIVDVIGRDTFARVEHNIRRAMDGHVVEFTFERNHPTGDQARVMNARLVPDISAGVVRGLYALVEDITEQRRAEAAARHAQWEMRAIADNLPALVAYVDADLRYRYVNTGYVAWYQRPLQDFIGHEVAELVGESIAVTGPRMRRVLAGERLEFEYLRHNPVFAEPDRILHVRMLPDSIAGEVRGFITLVEDITERRAAEDALRRAEQDTRAIIDTLPALVAAFDTKSRFVFANQHCAEWFATDARALVGRRLFELLSPEDTARIAPAVRRVLDGKRVAVTTELPLRDVDGHERHFRVEYVPLWDGAVLRGFVAVAQDITEAVKNEATIREQALLLRQLTDNSSEAFCVTNLRRTALIFGNPAHERMFGLTNEALIASGRSWIDFVHEEDRPAVAARFAATLANGGFDAEYRLVRADGTEQWVQDHADIVHDAAGKPVRLVTVMRDVTERRQQAEAIARNSARLAQAQRAARLGLWELDATTGAIYWSDEMYRILEVDPDVFVPTAETYGQLIHPDDLALVTARVEAAMAGREDYDLEHRIRLGDGRVVYLHSQATVEYDSQGRPRRMTGLVRDITQRRQAELALRQSEARLRQITETIDDAFWLLSLDGVTPFFVSHGFEHIFGRPCSSVQSNEHGWLDAVHASDRARMTAEFAAMRSGERLDTEYRIVRPDGSVRWVHEKTHPIHDEHERMVAIAGVTSDVTVRREQDDRLIAFGRRLERAQAVGNLGFWEIGIVDGTFWCSTQFRHIFDLLPDATTVRYADVIARIHDDDRARVQQEVEAVARDGSGFDIDHRVVLAAGDIRHVHCQGTLERDEHGRRAKLVGIVQDITARKQAEIEVREHALRLRQITENIEHVFWLYDTVTGTPVYVSPSYERIWDLPQARAYSEPMAWVSRVHPDDRDHAEAAFLACMTDGEAEIDFRILAHSGDMRWMHVRAFPIHDEQGRLYRVAGITEDITERRRMDEMKRLKEDAETANRLKTEFLSKMSHELRTPLNAILGFSQLLSYDKAEPLSTEQQENVDEILGAGRHLLEIVDDMLDVTRIELGKLRVEREALDLGAAVSECMTMVQRDAARRRITVDSSFRHDSSIVVLGDRTRVRQILLNLLTNAVKYIPEQGHVQVALATPGNDRCVRVCVADNGQGLNADELGKLFVPFQRLDAGRLRAEGVGLGLALSKQLAEAMGGELGADCTPGAGCTFWLELPRAHGA